MSHYIPDSWMIVKITGTDPHYRIFGSWSGGYLDGDAWRLNSGVKSVEEDDDYYYFKGHTGSVYQCHKEGYGIRSSYASSVLEGFLNKPEGHMELIEENPENVMAWQWKISYPEMMNDQQDAF